MRICVMLFGPPGPTKFKIHAIAAPKTDEGPIPVN